MYSERNTTGYKENVEIKCIDPHLLLGNSVCIIFSHSCPKTTKTMSYNFSLVECDASRSAYIGKLSDNAGSRVL
jgi:hypothetical protein